MNLIKWMRGTPKNLKTTDALWKRSLMLSRAQLNCLILSVSRTTWPSRRTTKRRTRFSAVFMSLRRRRGSNTMIPATNKFLPQKRNSCRNRLTRWQHTKSASNWEWMSALRNARSSTTAFSNATRTSKRRLKTSRIWRDARKNALTMWDRQLPQRAWWQVRQRWVHLAWNSPRWWDHHVLRLLGHLTIAEKGSTLCKVFFSSHFIYPKTFS